MPSCDHPFRKYLDSTNACDVAMRPFIPFTPYFGMALSLSGTKYSKSPNKSEFSNWLAVVSAADRPWLTPWVTAVVIKAEIDGGDMAKWYDIRLDQPRLSDASTKIGIILQDLHSDKRPMTWTFGKKYCDLFVQKYNPITGMKLIVKPEKNIMVSLLQWFITYQQAYLLSW